MFGELSRWLHKHYVVLTRPILHTNSRRSDYLSLITLAVQIQLRRRRVRYCPGGGRVLMRPYYMPDGVSFSLFIQSSNDPGSAGFVFFADFTIWRKLDIHNDY